MTDITQLAIKTGAVKCDDSGAFKGAFLFFQSDLIKLEQLLRDKFIAELGEPVGWQFHQDGEWFNGSDKFQHKKNTIEAGYPVREIFALKDKRK